MLKKQSAGYTVVEVMMFLAISSLLFISAVIAIGGRQAQVQFTQGVNDLESTLQDIINDVGTGFFPHSNDFRCNAPTNSGPITFSSEDDQQGTSANCVFLGKAIQFEPAGGSGTIKVITIVGKRTVNGSLASNLDQAQPRAVVGPPPEADITETLQLKNGIIVTDISVGSGANPYGGRGTLAFLSNFSNAPGEPGTSATRFTPIPLTSLNTNTALAVISINATADGNSIFNPPSGFVICLRERGGNRRASITIGGGGSGPVISVDFDTYNTAICTS
jgi:hypothetical protein